MSQNKKAIPMTGEAQAQAARLFGRHVSREKAFILFAVTMIACALPMITGVRLWESIPEIVETGITRMDGTIRCPALWWCSESPDLCAF